MIKGKRDLSILFAAAISLQMLSGTATAGELDARMAKVVKTFSRAAAEAGVSTATLAVMPFQTDKKLAEKRVNYACAEMLTTRFVALKTFTVTERTQLEEVMKEQRLGLSGAVESATAARVGKILGARLVILGSVSRLANAYHLSTEMVDSETGEIMASDVTEVAVEVFEKDASQYMVLVPDEQAIGLYGVFFTAPMVTVSAAAEQHFGKTITPTNPSANLTGLGVGVRYFPWSRWMMDLMVMAHTSMEPDEIEYSINGQKPNWGQMWRADGPTAQFTVNRVTRLSKRFNGFVGAGLTMISLYVDTQGVNESAPIEGLTVKFDDSNADIITPTARVGIEWKPKERFSLAVFGNYNLSQEVTKQTITIWNGPSREAMVIRKFSFPSFYVASTISLYF